MVRESDDIKWKWGNVPIPEAHLVGLVTGIALHLFLPRAILPVRWLGYALGGVFASAGIALAAWAVWQASEMSIDEPDRLLVTGPYAYSRNPMYVAWALITLGMAWLLNSLWLLALLVPILVYVHFVDIKREEAALRERFGEEYEAYRRRARRYL